MQHASTLRLYSLDYSNAKTYMVAALFILGNIALPQLVHLIPQGGLVWLPIYLFTLVGAYKYGWKVGLLTAVASPVINSALFGMPALHSLPPILLKSALLAVAAGIAASRFRKASLWLLAAVVLSYQTVGTLGEWAMKGDFYLAVQDFRIGLPGMLLQIFGGWLIINHLIRR
ncbi:MAG: ECF transporter S component [Candidatus Amulumruptor caecigallinarius]|nr:MAG: ECF transporter S component [Candidatus Amulumruptor caecigallinarius]